MIKNFKPILLVFTLIPIVLLLGCNPSEREVKAKYVFYFIGDGMGIQHVNIAEAYLKSINGQIENKPLGFTQFPITGFSTTYAATRIITCSAAAGTALATGTKTSISTIGLNTDHSDSLYSIAFLANKAGYQVGITTSVSIDHATPAAFYAHQPLRDLYHNIGHDLIKSGFRFFGGGGLIDPSGDKSKNPQGDVFVRGKEMGVYFTQNLNIHDTIRSKYKTIVYTDPNPAGGKSFQYYIDKDSTSVTLAKLTSCAVDILFNPKGFFLMVEGGKIDWACHHNDAATTIGEVVSFSQAIDVAIEFYKKYPKETLIVVTADHETGGMSLGNRMLGYESNIAILANQKESFDEFNRKVIRFKEQHNQKPSFESYWNFIASELGIDNNGFSLSETQMYNLKKAYNASLGIQERTQIDIVLDEYGSYDPLTVAAIQVLNQKAGIGWTSFSHTGSPVPVYALGIGQELFSGQMDNTDIPRKIAKIMKISME
jgi:alkaline phosphatase